MDKLVGQILSPLPENVAQMIQAYASETRSDWRSCKRAESSQIARRQRWHIFLTGGRKRREEEEDDDAHDVAERELRELYAGDAECKRLITNWVKQCR